MSSFFFSAPDGGDGSSVVPNTFPGGAHDLVLIGAGQSHVQVLKLLGLPGKLRGKVVANGINVTIITRELNSSHSSMLPGYVAGHYTWEELQLDVQRLARFAGARIVHATAKKVTYNSNPNNSNINNNNSIRTANRIGRGGWVECDDGRPPIRFDCLSIDIGSEPCLPNGLQSSPSLSDNLGVIPIKPILQFDRCFQQLLAKWTKRSMDDDDGQPYRLAIVGGGSSAVEMALSLQYRLLEEKHSNIPLHITIVTKGKTILESHNSTVQTIFSRIIKERKIEIVVQAQVVGIELHQLQQQQQRTTPPDGDDGNDDCTNHHLTLKRLILSNNESAAAGNTTTTTKPPMNPILFEDCIWCVNTAVSSWIASETPFPITRSKKLSSRQQSTSSSSITSPLAAAANSAAETTIQEGLIRVKSTYECIRHPGVFAVGHCCHIDDYPTAKAGSSSAGIQLSENLVRYLTRESLLRSRPQTNQFNLISTGDKNAVASKSWWLGMEAGGSWLWTIKDWMDQSYLLQYCTDYLPSPDYVKSRTPSVTPAATPALSSLEKQHLHGIIHHDHPAATRPLFIQSGGCNSKVASSTVSRALLKVYRRQVLRAAARESPIPLPEPMDHDDSAVVPLQQYIKNNNLDAASSPNAALVETTDYFTAMLTDPYVFGKIVATHCLSNVHAMGAAAIAQTAMSLAGIPSSPNEEMTESVLVHLLSGINDVLTEEGVRIVGGHTSEAPTLSCGLCVRGYTKDSTKLLLKRGGQVGDKIVLTKPLGIGALWAADSQAKANGEHVAEAVRTMILSNSHASRIALEHGDVHACTDVAGFGLIGHLLEMLMANETHHDLKSIGAVLDIRKIPFLQGGIEAAKEGMFSSLQKSNYENRRAVVNHFRALNAFPIQYQLLFDPQTAGGLIFFVSPDKCDSFLTQLQESENVSPSATVIGELMAFPELDQAYHDDGVCTVVSGEALSGQRLRLKL